MSVFCLFVLPFSARKWNSFLVFVFESVFEIHCTTEGPYRHRAFREYSHPIDLLHILFCYGLNSEHIVSICGRLANINMGILRQSDISVASLANIGIYSIN
jgi:hypothetical protein